VREPRLHGSFWPVRRRVRPGIGIAGAIDGGGCPAGDHRPGARPRERDRDRRRWRLIEEANDRDPLMRRRWSSMYRPIVENR
jgi:hypothetical protein